MKSLSFKSDLEMEKRPRKVSSIMKLDIRKVKANVRKFSREIFIPPRKPVSLISIMIIYQKGTFSPKNTFKYF